MQAKGSFPPFGIRDKIGYLFGDLGNDFTFLLSSSFLLKFYTDVMGVKAFVIGIVMMVARFTDAFTDVAMGRICDKGRTTGGGKFKPWLLRMCVPVALSSFLIYQSRFANASMTFKIFWLSITYILWGSVFYTSVNIPYGSMASAISGNPDDRQSLSTFRTMGGMLAGAIVSIGVPLFAYEKVIRDGEEQLLLSGSRFTLIAGIFSLFSVFSYLLCYFLTTERIRENHSKAPREHRTAFAMLKSAFSNRALLSIIVASVVMLLAQLTMQGMAGYIFPNYYRSASAQSVSTLLMSIGMILAATVAKPLCRRFGKAEVSALSNLFAALICGALFFFRPENVWVYVAFQFLCWFGLGIFAMVNWALITDVIDDAELRNGVREDGSVYAIYSFARKLGQAAAAGLSGGLLSLIGYSQDTAFDKPVVEGIFNISTLIPAVGFLALALVLWFWYPLHKQVVEKNVLSLQEKHSSDSKKKEP